MEPEGDYPPSTFLLYLESCGDKTQMISAQILESKPELTEKKHGLVDMVLI